MGDNTRFALKKGGMQGLVPLYKMPEPQCGKWPVLKDPWYKYHKMFHSPAMRFSYKLRTGFFPGFTWGVSFFLIKEATYRIYCKVQGIPRWPAHKPLGCVAAH